MVIMATDSWPDNAHLIADCAKLGYLHKNGYTLDPTYGLGRFWTVWRPDDLVGSDIVPTKSLCGTSVDFRHLPWPDSHFEHVVFDGPYKLNGTPAPPLDSRYGVDVPKTWQERITLLLAGVAECCRVCDGYLLVKCQDQVVSGAVRWQTRLLADEAERHGAALVDRLDMISYRPQPHGTRQLHARRNSSTMLVFQKPF